MKFSQMIYQDPIAAALYVLRVTLLLLVLLFLSFSAYAKPVAVLNHQDLRVTLYDEPCALDVQLQYRAVWQDKDKTYEGCFGVNQGIVVAWFADKSIAIFPGQLFKPVTEL